jgi:hypothetical protein
MRRKITKNALGVCHNAKKRYLSRKSSAAENSNNCYISYSFQTTQMAALSLHGRRGSQFIRNGRYSVVPER